MIQFLETKRIELREIVDLTRGCHPRWTKNSNLLFSLKQILHVDYKTNFLSLACKNAEKRMRVFESSETPS